MNDYLYYKNLSENECKQLVGKLFIEIQDNDEIENILLHLSLFSSGECLKDLYPKLIEKQLFYPPEIYKHADSNIADKLIQFIESGKYNNNHLLICLAWIGTKNVIDFFVYSSNKKPKWTKNLYVLPIDYADQAGWVIDKNGEKRMLINRNIKVLKNTTGLNEKPFGLSTFIQLEEKCPFCNGNLTKVFSTQLKNKTVEFATCMLCNCYNPVFMNINKDGKSSWHEKNIRWEHLDDSMEMEPIKENTLRITDENRNPEYTISQFIEISKSQIGGFPTWIQDAEYLNCPNCGYKMDFIGQIDMEDVKEYGEGIYYFQYCKSCDITGTNYQQT
jgi:hypothetical protein